MRLIIVFSLALFFSVRPSVAQMDSSGTLLYNGIRLPAAWPPKNMSAISTEPMVVPYLDSPPKVIPIDKGRQLFVDDFLIESTDMTRRFHQAKKYEGNPVFSPQTAQELAKRDDNTAVTYLGHGGVFYEPKESLYKMFYYAGWRGGLALATSKDLIHWKRPELHLAGGNLILPAGPLWAGGDNAVWLDLSAKDSMQRYKMITERVVDQSWKENYVTRAESPTHTLHVSPDGLHWSQGIVAGRAADYTSFFFNPFRSVWVYSLKYNSTRGRARQYSESADFLRGASWSNRVFWTGADRLDKPDDTIGDTAQLYSLNAVAYESILLGEFYIHLGPQNSVAEKGRYPKITEIELGFSRNGFHWSRPDRTAFIRAERKEGSWDKGYIHGTNGVMLVSGDRLWFPYTGFSGKDKDGATGMYTGASIGLAYLRRDGFASMDAGMDKTVLVTRPVTFKGSYLFVNVDCPRGELKVEVLDEKGKVIPSFSVERCQAIRIDKTLHQVSWQGQADLSVISGRPVQLRFYLTNGKLYSFWVSPAKSGASYGYLGAGSPGNHGIIDNKGINGYQ